MAEPLYHLGDSVTWSPTSAPRGQLVLIQDCVEAGGEFLVHHFTSLFLKAGHRVCFVASANDPQHYAAVGRKLGVNFAACERKKQLQVLDWTEVEADRDEGAWTVLFHKLKTFTSQEQEENVEISGVSIVLDDVSALKWRFGDAAVLDFARCCKTLTHEKNGAANVVLLSHADTDLPTSRPLSPALADMATMVLATKPLTTGYSKDIHGTLSVYHQNQGLVGNSLHEEPPAIPYKILESTIKCFHSGGEALQWN
uniref:Elongator complex protein 6 n=1 Tax=Phytophthora ramorum TaxID=164328 RepID=H3GQI8_PHYRM